MREDLTSLIRHHRKFCAVSNHFFPLIESCLHSEIIILNFLSLASPSCFAHWHKGCNAAHSAGSAPCTMPELPLNCNLSKKSPVSVSHMSARGIHHGGAVWSNPCFPLQDLGVPDPSFPLLNTDIHSCRDPMQQNEGNLNAFDSAATPEELLGPREEAFQGEFPFQSASIPICPKCESSALPLSRTLAQSLVPDHPFACLRYGPKLI